MHIERKSKQKHNILGSCLNRSLVLDQFVCECPGLYFKQHEVDRVGIKIHHNPRGKWLTVFSQIRQTHMMLSCQNMKAKSCFTFCLNTVKDSLWRTLWHLIHVSLQGHKKIHLLFSNLLIKLKTNVSQ